jgi:hypothetical protein
MHSNAAMTGKMRITGKMSGFQLVSGLMSHRFKAMSVRHADVEPGSHSLHPEF